MPGINYEEIADALQNDGITNNTTTNKSQTPPVPAVPKPAPVPVPEDNNAQPQTPLEAVVSNEEASEGIVNVYPQKAPKPFNYLPVLIQLCKDNYKDVPKFSFDENKRVLYFAGKRAVSFESGNKITCYESQPCFDGKSSFDIAAELIVKLTPPAKSIRIHSSEYAERVAYAEALKKAGFKGTIEIYDEAKKSWTVNQKAEQPQPDEKSSFTAAPISPKV